MVVLARNHRDLTFSSVTFFQIAITVKLQQTKSSVIVQAVFA
jgi:hypothetical protein